MDADGAELLVAGEAQDHCLLAGDLHVVVMDCSRAGHVADVVEGEKTSGEGPECPCLLTRGLEFTKQFYAKTTQYLLLLLLLLHVVVHLYLSQRMNAEELNGLGLLSLDVLA